MPARLALAIILSLAAPAAAEERYYVTFFGSQSTPRVARGTHTFVAVSRVAASAVGPVVDTRVISWLPATLAIKPLRFRPEPGVNLPLDRTLDYVRGNGERVSVWGPYRVLPEPYHRLIAQADLVDSGYYQYQAIDSIRPAPDVVDCIHAVTDADPSFGRYYYPLLRFGDSATHRVVQQFFERDLILDRHVDQGWLLPRLGVPPGEVARRDFRGSLVIPGLDPGWRLRGTLLPTRWGR